MSYDKLKTETYSQLGGINSKISSYINGPEEFRDLTNLNFFVPGALSKRPGTSLYIGATISGRITGGVEFERLNGASYIVVTANTNAYTVAGSFSSFKTGLLDAALFDFITFVDRLFACNGQDFFKFDGTNTSAYSLPPGATGWGVTAVVGGGLSGTFVTSYGYLNNRGYFGPASNGLTIALNGITFGSIQYYGLTTVTGYGITALSFYRTSAGGIDEQGTTFAPINTATFTDTAFPLATRLSNDNLWVTTAPRYMEIYNNQLFMAGFSALLSTVLWSNIGEPEGVDPTFNAEFRTNDGDRVTGLKSYNGALVVTKERSTHRLVGGNPDNFAIQEITDQYGCLSNRAMVTFEDYLWFLDTKGIVEYNGANIKIISEKVEPIFSSMNIAAARENAVAIHNRQFNEVWFSIPCNGASLNNCVVVYDYLAKAWTKYEGVDSSALFQAKGALSQRSVFVGGYTGSIFFFGASLTSDQGRSITCMMQPRFLAPTGHTTERQFRRLYLDVNPILGITQAINVDFRTNYGTSIVLTRTMYQAPYQSRIDFGLSAKSIQPTFTHVSASLPLQINGFTFESRFQRPV